MTKESLWQKFNQSRDESLRQELILEYLGLVKYIAGRLAVRLPRGMTKEDLESCGVLGLMEAIDRYDPDSGTEFESFAGMRIRGAMYDEIRKANWIPRTTWQKLSSVYQTREELEKSLGRSATEEEVAEKSGLTVAELNKLNNHLSNLTYLSLDESPVEEEENLKLSDILPDQNSPDPLVVTCENDDKETLTRAVSLLNEKDRLILALYYQEEFTLKEIGQVLEVSESRVCQLHSRAIARLRKKISELSGENV